MKENRIRSYTYEMVTQETSLDVFGHMNHAQYLRILEEARWDLLSKNGYGLDVIQKTQKGPVILEEHALFKKELFSRQKICVETQWIEYPKLVGRLSQKIFNEARDLCLEAEIVVGFFDLKERKLLPPTEAWLSAIELPTYPFYRAS